MMNDELKRVLNSSSRIPHSSFLSFSSSPAPSSTGEGEGSAWLSVLILERLHGVRLLGLGALGRDEDARVPEVLRHAHVRHRHTLDPRVFQLETHDLADLLA